jgi:hypothetical protein
MQELLFDMFSLDLKQSYIELIFEKQTLYMVLGLLIVLELLLVFLNWIVIDFVLMLKLLYVCG